MARSDNLFGRLFHKRALKRWAENAKQAKTAELEHLNLQRENARQLRSHLDEVIEIADQRFAHAGQGSIEHPRNASWVWRPELWSEPIYPRSFSRVQNSTSLGGEAKIFHDSANVELSLHQIRNHPNESAAPFAAQIEVFKIEGSFLSIVLDLPSNSIEGLKKRHIVRVDTMLECESPVKLFSRLNVKHGPNTEQIVQEMSIDSGPAMAEFDLAFTSANEQRIEKMWLDLIFEKPAMNQITIRDLTMYRYPRAEL